MTTFATQGIAIGGGKKKKGTTIAATLPSDFYKHYQPPRAPRIKPMKEGASSLVTMADMSLPDSAGTGKGLSSDMDSLDIAAKRTGGPDSSSASAGGGGGAADDGEEEAKPLHSMSLRDDGLAGPRTLPSKGLTSRGAGDAGAEDAADAPVKVGSLTAMDLMKMAPSAGLKTRRFGAGDTGGSRGGGGGGGGGSGLAADSTKGGDASSSKPSSDSGAKKKKKGRTQYAMEQDSDSDESEDESG